MALDGDDPEHIQWVFQRSLERAAEFSITGVTYRLTQGEQTITGFVSRVWLNYLYFLLDMNFLRLQKLEEEIKCIK